MNKSKHLLRPTIGILFPGEMGSSLGKLLAADGHAVVTTCAGRSPRTRRLCAESGLPQLESVRALLQAADVVISLVPPPAAVDVAEEFCAALGAKAPRLYIDANAISPATAASIAEILRPTGIEFLDASIHGLASRLRQQGTLFVSGPAAGEAERLFGATLRVRNLGPVPGRASLMKMLAGGMSKGLVALFLELSLLAQYEELLGEFLAVGTDYYPGVMTAIERLLPTYPQHAARRSAEMRELAGTFDDLGLRSGLAPEIARLLGLLGEADLAGRAGSPPSSVADLIELISTANLLRPAEVSARPTQFEVLA